MGNVALSQAILGWVITSSYSLPLEGHDMRKKQSGKPYNPRIPTSNLAGRVGSVHWLGYLRSGGWVAPAKSFRTISIFCMDQWTD